MTDRIMVTVDGAVTTIILNRPEVMNAIDPQMHGELEEAFNGYAANPHQRICVITGSGAQAFCAGTDLKDAFTRQMAKTDYPWHGYAGLVERYDLDKPVIAAVNGLALGGGFELALACDIILADANASFGLPEPLVGAVPLGGGIHRLARQIGEKRAMGMLLSSQRVDAAEGMRLGFVNAVADAGDLPRLVDRWITNILAGAPLAVQAIKQAVRCGLNEPDFATAMQAQDSYPAWRVWEGSEEARDGVAAFVEKRPPPWQR